MKLIKPHEEKEIINRMSEHKKKRNSLSNINNINSTNFAKEIAKSVQNKLNSDPSKGKNLNINQNMKQINPFINQEIEVDKNQNNKTTVNNIWNGIKTTLTNAYNSIKNIFTKVKNTIVNTLTTAKNKVKSIFESIRSIISDKASAVLNKAKSIFQKVKDAITNPIDKAKDLIKGIIDKIKGFFNFKVPTPHIPLPHFAITPSGWRIGDLLKGSIPGLSIDWYKDGGFFNGPTVLSGVGEDGPEYVLPLSRRSLAPLAQLMNEMLIKEGQTRGALESQPLIVNTDLYVDGRKIASTTAPYMRSEIRKINTSEKRQKGLY